MIRASFYTIALAVAILLVPGTAAQAQFGGNDDLVRELQRRAAEAQDDGRYVDPTVPRQAPMTSRPMGDDSVGTSEQRSMRQEMVSSDKEDLTTLERDYSRRADQKLGLIGYDSLRGDYTPNGGLYGAAPDDYILGPGDEVVITLRGQQNATYTTRVDREGQVILPDLPPIPAGSRSFEDFATAVQTQVDASLLETRAHVSLGRVRQISVLVSGEVRRPGVFPMTGQSTVIEALIAAGGVKKTGSLRTVRLIRDNRTRDIDLYGVLLTGRAAPDMRLMEGDRLVVPPLSATVAVAGEVVRPGIYELSGDGIRADALLGLAGGTMRGLGYRYFRISPTADGPGAVEPLLMDQPPVFHQGDILMVAKTAESRVGYVSVEGHVTAPGQWSLATSSRLSDLLSTPGLLDDSPYLPFVIVQTRDPVSLATRYEAVDGIAVRLGLTNYQFRDRDTVIFLSERDVQYLSSADVQKVLTGTLPAYGLTEEEPRDPFAEKPDLDDVLAKRQAWQDRQDRFRTRLAMRRDTEPKKGARPANLERDGEIGDTNLYSTDLYSMEVCGGLRKLAALVRRRGTDAGLLPVMSPADDDDAVIEDVQACPRIYDRFPDILPFVMEHAAGILGEVRRPGVYPVVTGTRVADVVRAAGGPTSEAELSLMELDHVGGSHGPNTGRQEVSYDEAMRSAHVAPGDYVRISPRFEEQDGGVIVMKGEVRKPGVYTIRRGERLSEVLARAGGLTEEAYPAAAVFTREEVRKTEAATYEVMARELESSLSQSVAMSRVEGQSAGDLLPMVDRMVSSLRQAKAVGRVSATVDPVVLQVRPELDTILQSGDRLYIPARPNHVAVTGEVLHAGVFQHTAGASAEDYVRKAGGTRETADEARIFVILPSGEARPLHVSFWNYQESQIPPGSTIVVPPDLTPFSFWERTKDLTQVLGQIAISAASLAVINRN